LNPVSSAELSSHNRATWLEEIASAERPLGSAGGLPGVAVGVRVGVRVGVNVGVGVRVGVRVGVNVGEGVRVEVRVGVGVDAKVVPKAALDGSESPAVL
jgi:hypothetical protein